MLHPQIGRDLSYSERLLRYMRLCCCVGFFCSCCAEPEGRNAKDSRWREQSGVQHPPPPPPPTQQPQQQQARKGKAKGPVGVEPAAPSYPRVNADGLDEESKQVGVGNARCGTAVAAQQGMSLVTLSSGAGNYLEQGLHRQKVMRRRRHQHGVVCHPCWSVTGRAASHQSAVTTAALVYNSGVCALIRMPASNSLVRLQLQPCLTRVSCLCCVLQVIDNETAAQDDYLDQISRGLDQLKVKARAMNEEVRGQEAHVGALQTDTTALNERLRNTNRQGFRV